MRKKCGNVDNKWKCSSKKKNYCIKIIRDQIRNHSAFLNFYLFKYNLGETPRQFGMELSPPFQPLA